MPVIIFRRPKMIRKSKTIECSGGTDFPEELVAAFGASEFWITQGDFIKPGTVGAVNIRGAAVRALDLIHAAQHREPPHVRQRKTCSSAGSGRHECLLLSEEQTRGRDSHFGS